MVKRIFKAGRFSIALLGLLVAPITSVRAESAKLTYAPVPDWVRETTWKEDAGLQVNPNSSGTRCLLYETQERPRSHEEFIREALLMENENGVQDSGSLSIGFNAEYESLCLHRVVIHRNGRTIERLNPAKVKLIQQERGLGGHMFTGRQTAVLFVEDLRVGDVLEYAYTTRGANPILAGHFSTRFYIQTGVPVDLQVFRVLWEEKIPLQRRQHLNDAKPVVMAAGQGTEYCWSFTNLPAIPYEDYRPLGCEPYPYLELSDFPNWEQVAKWALPLYDMTVTNTPAAMRDMIFGWEKTATSNEEKARLALEFVQDGLRYTGIELGPDSYRPSNPVETFEKRFGDCKGKVALLRFLLQQMGIKSHPALVNSSTREAVQNRLPTPFAFNHVILQILLDGKTVWVDPTISHQGGLLWNRYLPPYGRALVVRPHNDGLDTLPGNSPEAVNQRLVTSIFTVKDYGQPVPFTVRTEYRGVSADYMRDDIASDTPEDIAKNFLNYYARFYSGIVTNAPIKISDNRKSNIVTVEEFYTITNLWKCPDEKRLMVARFYADDLYNMLTDPRTRLRKYPLSLTHPMIRKQDVLVKLPDTDWNISDYQTNIENAAFSFNYNSHYSGNTVSYHYECRTKLSEIAPEEVPGYLINMDRMENLLTDGLQRPKERQPDGVNWLMAVIAIFGTTATMALCVFFWRFTRTKSGQVIATAETSSPSDAAELSPSRPAPPILAANPELQGLGGWLILICIGLCLAPFIRSATLYHGWHGYFSQQVWQVVAMPQGEKYHPLYAPLLMLELLGNIFLLGLNLLALVLFFGKRRAFPNVFIALALCNALFLILDNAGCALIPYLKSGDAGKAHTNAMRAVTYAIIWSLYMVKSRRVKATFVN